jgi:hypothetical protein
MNAYKIELRTALDFIVFSRMWNRFIVFISEVVCWVFSFIWFWIRHIIYCGMTRFILRVVKKIQLHIIFTYIRHILNFLLCYKIFPISIFFNWKTVFSYLRLQIMDCTNIISVVYRDLISWKQEGIESCVNALSQSYCELFCIGQKHKYRLYCIVIKHLNCSINWFVYL